MLAKLCQNEDFLALLDKCERLQETNSAVQDALEEKILTAWRRKHPRFASMGTVDSVLQSERLKDTEEFARR